MVHIICKTCGEEITVWIRNREHGIPDGVEYQECIDCFLKRGGDEEYEQTQTTI